MLSKVMQNEYFLLKIDFQSGNFILNDFWKQKLYFLTLDKIFILDNFSFVQDKKYFVRAEGRGKSRKCKNCSSYVSKSQQELVTRHWPRPAFNVKFSDCKDSPVLIYFSKSGFRTQSWSYKGKNGLSRPLSIDLQMSNNVIKLL